MLRRGQPKHANLEEVLCSGVGVIVAGFLKGGEVSVLLGLNKRVTCALATDPAICRLRLARARVAQDNRADRAIQELNYYRLMAEKVPEEVMRRSMLRYLFLRRQAGSFMVPVINKAGQMFEYKSFQMREEITFEEELAMVTNPEDRTSSRGQVSSLLLSTFDKEVARLQ